MQLVGMERRLYGRDFVLFTLITWLVMNIGMILGNMVLAEAGSVTYLITSLSKPVYGVFFLFYVHYRVHRTDGTSPWTVPASAGEWMSMFGILCIVMLCVMAVGIESVKALDGIIFGHEAPGLSSVQDGADLALLMSIVMGGNILAWVSGFYCSIRFHSIAPLLIIPLLVGFIYMNVSLSSVLDAWPSFRVQGIVLPILSLLLCIALLVASYRSLRRIQNRS